MKLVLSARVEADIAAHLQYGIETFGPKVAAKTFARVDTFLNKFLPAYPRTGRRLTPGGIFESWISRTPFVVMYRLDEDHETITVLAMFHHSQDRGEFATDSGV